MSAPLFRVGRVLRASGLRGELRIQFFRPRRATLGDQPGVVELELPRGERRAGVRVERARFVDASNAVVKLGGVDDRDAAEALHGAFVFIDPSAPPASIADEADRLLGARAISAESGAELGTIVALEDNGAQVLLVLETSSGEEKLIPFVPDFVDLSGTNVRIRAIPGLIEDEA